MTSTEILYCRVRIHGHLTVQSPLHVGGGDTEPLEGRDRTGRNPKEPDKGEFATVGLNDDGLPYLPGSTLRGFLRSRLHRTGNDELIKRLFGYVDPKSETKTDETRKGHAGILRLYDAPLDPESVPDLSGNRLWNEDRRTLIRQSVALNPLTLTADEHKLFSYEYLPAGNRFGLIAEAEELREGELEIILGLLQAWDGGAGACLGRGASRMQGRLLWERDRVEVLTPHALERWLTKDEPLANAFEILPSASPAALAAPNPLRTAGLRIRPSAPLLVNDPGYVRRKPKDGGPKENEFTPDHEYSRMADGRAMIPAASLRGVVRGRARRILATLLAERGVTPKQAGDEAERLLSRLFGGLEWRGPLWIGDAVATSATAPHAQYFNAIDRFTGGVADGKLYNVNARDGGVYEGEIGLETNRLESFGLWWKGLLLLVLRDALEGELAVGWGKARGYGAFRFELEWNGGYIGDWSEVVKSLETPEASISREMAQEWIDGLHKKLDDIVIEVRK